MTPYTRKRGKKAEAERLQNTNPADGEISNKGLQDTIRELIKEVLSQEKTQEKAPEEPPISSAVSQPEKAEHDTEQIVMQKLSRFKKFVPSPFSEAKTLMEAED